MTQDYKEEKEVPLHRKPQQSYMKFDETASPQLNKDEEEKKRLGEEEERVVMF